MVGWPVRFAIDYDPRDGHAVLSKDALWELIVTTVPELADVDVVWA